MLMSLQAFVRPGGEIFLFRTASVPEAPGSLMPPLAWKASRFRSWKQGVSLVVLEKRQSDTVSRTVPRETPEE